jgi:hypothetical protein
MYAMPADTPIPAKLPRRLTFRRVLLAIVLGLAAWWGVGGWLSAKPQLLLRFADSGISTLPGPGYINASFSVDKEGEELLLIIRSDVSAAGRMTVERFNLTTGQQMSARDYTPKEFFNSPDFPDTSVKYLLSNGMKRHQLRIMDGFDYLRDYPEWKQSVRMRYISYGPLDPWLRELPGLGRWLYRPSVGIWDDEGGRFLWSVPQYDTRSDEGRRTDVMTNESGRVVIVVQSMEKQHEVAVVEIPLPITSPWWSRAIGLLVAAFVLFTRRRRPSLSPS